MFCLFVVKQYILARVAGDRADKKKDAKGRRLVDRGSVYSIGFASSHRPTTTAGMQERALCCEGALGQTLVTVQGGL